MEERHASSSRAKLAANSRAEMRGCPVLDGRGRGEIDAEAGDNPVARPLEQDAAEFRAAKHHVVRPFEHHCAARRGDVHGFDQGQAGGKCQ
jgi:hypothetical protein